MRRQNTYKDKNLITNAYIHTCTYKLGNWSKSTNYKLAVRMDLFIKVENAKWTNFDSTSYNFFYGLEIVYTD